MFAILMLVAGCDTTEDFPPQDPDTPNDPDEPIVVVKPDHPELPLLGDNQIIRHEAYTLSYNEKYEQAEWVAYELTGEHAASKEFDRTDDFRPDSLVLTGSAELADYFKSGFDRGHLMPAGDCRWNEKVMSESFYMSNMSPQNPQFNRNRWRFLEMQVRDWAVKYGALYVITAGVLIDGLPTIGDNEVAIPNQYYKVITDTAMTKGIAFLLPNENLNKDSIQNYFTTIDEVERATGLDFFPWLSMEQEQKLEGKTDTSLWGFKYK